MRAKTISALITAINDNPRAFVVATGTGDTTPPADPTTPLYSDLILTAKEDGISFFTAVPTNEDGLEIAGIEIEATTTPQEGSGTPAHIKSLQEEAAGLGFLNRTYFPQTPTLYSLKTGKVGDSVAEGTDIVGYDLLYLNVKNNNSENVVSGNKTSQLILAFPASATADDSTLADASVTEAVFKTMFGL